MQQTQYCHRLWCRSCRHQERGLLLLQALQTRYLGATASQTPSLLMSEPLWLISLLDRIKYLAVFEWVLSSPVLFWATYKKPRGLPPSLTLYRHLRLRFLFIFLVSHENLPFGISFRHGSRSCWRLSGTCQMLAFYLFWKVLPESTRVIPSPSGPHILSASKLFQYRPKGEDSARSVLVGICILSIS